MFGICIRIEWHCSLRLLDLRQMCPIASTTTAPLMRRHQPHADSMLLVRTFQLAQHLSFLKAELLSSALYHLHSALLLLRGLSLSWAHWLPVSPTNFARASFLGCLSSFCDFGRRFTARGSTRPPRSPTRCFDKLSWCASISV